MQLKIPRVSTCPGNIPSLNIRDIFGVQCAHVRLRGKRKLRFPTDGLWPSRVVVRAGRNLLFYIIVPRMCASAHTRAEKRAYVASSARPDQRCIVNCVSPTDILRVLRARISDCRPYLSPRRLRFEKIKREERKFWRTSETLSEKESPPIDLSARHRETPLRV